jgi:hypothetical protein
MLLGVLVQSIIHFILNLLWIELKVLAHLLVEESESLVLLDSHLHLLLIVSVLVEGNCVIVLILHYVQYFALLWVLQLLLLFLLLVSCVYLSLLVLFKHPLSVSLDLLSQLHLILSLLNQFLDELDLLGQTCLDHISQVSFVLL